MKDEIKRIAHVSQGDTTSFFRGLREELEKFDVKLRVDIQYSTTMQPDGRAIFSALLIGRERGDSDS